MNESFLPYVLNSGVKLLNNMSSRTSLEYFLGRDLVLQHALQLTIGFLFGTLLVQNHERKLNYYGEKELNSFFMMEKVEKIFQSIINVFSECF